MKSLSKLGKTIMKIRTMNLYSKKSKNNDKKVSNTVPQQTSTLKAVPLALLLTMNAGNISAGGDLKSFNLNPKEEITGVVSKPVSAPQQEETISPENQKKLNLLREMCFGNVKGGRVDLTNEENKLVCVLKDIHEEGTDNRLGDAVFILYLHPENEKEYNELKKAGHNPKPEHYPTEEAYLIPINVFEGKIKLESDEFAFFMGEDKDYDIKTDFYSFKCESYPDPLCKFRFPDLAVRREDALKYYNFNKDGWGDWDSSGRRLGMTKEVPVTLSDGIKIRDYLRNNY